MEQNINMVHKVNEANHTYQDMRIKAKRRIKRKASLFDIERRRKEFELQRTLGVESYNGKNEVIFWGMVTATFWCVVAYLVWVSL